MARDADPKSADWWRRSLLVARLGRGSARLWLGGAALLPGACIPQADVQPAPPVLAGATPLDVTGSTAWRARLADLAQRLAPRRDDLLPYYVPTLFQVPVGPEAERLTPIHTAEMDADFARGLALRELFEEAGWPGDTAVVIDAPGVRAVAVAAALAEAFDPVFTFGNWPHPAGVVPADETLAATLYYLPLFETSRAARGAAAPPMFVLDANRLAPYKDEGSRFDNRYFARLPSAAQLAALGVRHVLYVNADGEPELDDLNQPLTELVAQGIDVRLAALADFQRGDALDEEDADAETFWFGGSPEWQVTFWDNFGWYHVPRVVWCHHHGIGVGPPRSAPPHLGPCTGHPPQPRMAAARASGHVGGRSGSLGRAGGGHSG